jgi:hypothetical protein
MTRAPLVLVLVLGLVLVLASCKKDDPKTEKPTPSASPSSAITAEGGPPCRNDGSKKLDANGKLVSCVLTKPYPIDGYTCEWGKPFDLHPDGKLRSCWFREAKTINDVSCHDHVSFHASGKLERCRLYASKKDVVPGVDLHSGDWVSFYESGAVQRLELVIAPMTVQGVTCKGHQNYFHENGKLKQCELASPDGGAKLVCFDDKGVRRPDCS